MNTKTSHVFVCSDDRLKVMKEVALREDDYLGLALLSRLDAAENAKRAHHSFDDCMCEQCIIWRKAAGK